jgi:glutamine amidotransferase
MIALIDYGMGNIHSVKKALEASAGEVLVTSKGADILAADKIVLPGVGAFDDAMDELDCRGLTAVLKSAAESGKPLLGICLGMQLLFERSEEAKLRKGLGVLKGEVKRFPEGSFKIPHIGWNQARQSNKASGLFKGVDEGAYFYFCHSYYCQPKDKSMISANCDYGLVFACAVESGNLFGLQFHPEKSQGAGLKIMDNFVRLCS